MRKFKCIHSWARDTQGDIVENYMMQRYPREIRERHFEEIYDKKVKEVPVEKPADKDKPVDKQNPKKDSEIKVS